MALPVALRAFRHGDFRRFFTAQLVAQIGSWMQTVAQSWLVLTLTSSPLLLGLIGTLQFSPILLLSIVSGALADRLPKKRLLIITQAVLGGQALLLGALVYVGHVEYWHVHDLDCAPPDDAIPQLEHEILRLLDRLAAD